MKKDIQERTFNFGLRIIKVGDSLPSTRSGNVIGKQLIRSGTSVGANVEEAEAAYTKDDFIYKMNIALKEARETHYWLRMVKASGMLKPTRLDSIIKEADELKKILGAIVSKARGKSKK
ncbi:MAG: four helix bundle protein [Ignavibacteriales bacterium]|nr:four helix bundle protein [Ignavibacteriales bacterium]